jgi:hypothetical protein
MDLSTIEMDPAQARQALIEYRTALREGPKRKLGEAEREYMEMDAAIKRGYRELSKGNRLLKLPETLRAGGTTDIEARVSEWRDGKNIQVWETFQVPRIAITRADASYCWTQGVHRDGHVSFHANQWHGWGGRKTDKLTVHAFGEDTQRPRQAGTFRAMVPTVPPPFRPPHSLAGYHLLWEADWTAQAPVDPALLKHLGGDLYVVLAVWDLSELERAVLGERR